MNINFKEILSAFVVLFAILDIIGSIPVIITIKERSTVSPIKISLISLLLLVIFYYVGDGILSLFGVDISSFAVAGSIVIFAVAIEMIFDIQVFKYDENSQNVSSIVPLVFPLIVGAGSFTTLLSLKAEYHTVNIMIALVLNVIVIYVVLKLVTPIEKLLGRGGIYILRKFFGIILLAIAVRLFTTNLESLWGN